jgi:undecaprenyl-diphosphatase
MPLEQLILLAIIQGLTEFLPISSSAHLILLPELMGLEDQGPLIDVAVHVGSLLAVVLYFRRDVAGLFAGVAHTAQRRRTAESRLLWALILATIPTVAAGGALYLSGAVDSLRSAEVIGWATLVFGILLYESDRIGMRFKNVDDLTLRGAIVVGLFQVLSLIPGTSRSGITITAGRFLGLERSEAARFSMLLSLPTIGIFGVLAGWELWRSGETVLQTSALSAAVLSFVSAYAAIWFFMSLVNRIGLLPFTLYRVVMGLGLLGYVYFIA